MKTLIFSVLIILCVFLTSCATIVNGNMQEIAFESNPTGAHVFLNGKPEGKTPFTKELKRDKVYDVKIQLEGYQPYKMQITKTLEPWFLGNIVSWNLLGFIIDAANGSMFQLTPDEIYIELEKGDVSSIYKFEATIETCSNGQLEKIIVPVVMKPDPIWKKIGILEKVSE